MSTIDARDFLERLTRGEGMSNRYVCSVISEMRDLLEKLDEVNGSGDIKAREKVSFIDGRILFLKGMLEEIQVYVNRMEAGLNDKWDIHFEQERLVNLKKKRRNLQKRVKELEEELGEEDDE